MRCEHSMAAWFLLLSFGCGDDDPAAPVSDAGGADAGALEDAGASGIPLLGSGAHTPDAVDVSVLATRDHRLYLVSERPTDPPGVADDILRSAVHFIRGLEK